jgi:hypothetical protein
MSNQDVDNALGGYGITNEERKWVMERRADMFSGAREVVWSEIERQSRLAIIEENYFATGSDLA